MSREIGNRYESLAKSFLEKQCLKILEQNFHSYRGEIDLICKDQSTLVFVEVRYRQKTQFANSIESIGPQKRKHLIQTARYYLQQKRIPEHVSCRFDVIAMRDDPLNPIEWIQNAFSL